ncbi:hypothetical protein KAW50_06500 [candidate division WOR-3 bacterium]|nr:hypothetical protein [candidate division WOR-3 bacterium]
MIEGEREEIRREATVPVQSRIDIRTLAEVCQYFADGGAEVSTASQLVSWSLEVLVETLKRNDKVRNEKPSIEAAYQYLESNGLMQKRMKRKKLIMVRGFEELRMEGEDPRVYAAGSYKSLHNNPNWTGKMPQIEKINEEVNKSSKHGNSIDEAFRRAEEEDEKQRKENIEKFKDNCDMDESGAFIPKGEPYGTITEKDMKDYEEREKKREREEELNKKDRRLERREKKMLNKQDDLNEEEENKDG